MTRRTLPMAALAIGLLSAGCSGGKEQAAVAVDEAKLNLSAAENAGADLSAPDFIFETKRLLSLSEKDMAKGHYGQARELAEQANVAALRAKSLAETAKTKAAEPGGTKPSPKRIK
jgi:hypothetical protein